MLVCALAIIIKGKNKEDSLKMREIHIVLFECVVLEKGWLLTYRFLTQPAKVREDKKLLCSNRCFKIVGNEFVI